MFGNKKHKILFIVIILIISHLILIYLERVILQRPHTKALIEVIRLMDSFYTVDKVMLNYNNQMFYIGFDRIDTLNPLNNISLISEHIDDFHYTKNDVILTIYYYSDESIFLIATIIHHNRVNLHFDNRLNLNSFNTKYGESIVVMNVMEHYFIGSFKTLFFNIEEFLDN